MIGSLRPFPGSGCRARRRRRAARTRHARRGSAYVLILIGSAIVTAVGLATAALWGVRDQTARIRHDTTRAGQLARAAISHALTVMNAYGSEWRVALNNGQEAPAMTLGEGTFRWSWIDEADGDLDDDDTEVVTIRGRGMFNGATRVLTVQARPTGTPLEVLGSTIASSGTILVGGSANLTSTGGPVTTNGTLDLQGTLTGDAGAQNRTGGGTITGTLVLPASTRRMPSPTVFDSYLSRATPIAWESLSSGTMSAPILSATINPWGTANPEGIYVVTIPSGQTLRINVSRLSCTLLVQGTLGGTIRCESAMIWEPSTPDLPILLVRGPLMTTMLHVPATTISESSIGANLNPPGLPYAGVSDTVTDDTYQSGLYGLIYIANNTTTNTSIGNGCRLFGTLIVDGPVRVATSASVTYDPNTWINAPAGFRTSSSMRAIPGTWKWVVGP